MKEGCVEMGTPKQRPEITYSPEHGDRIPVPEPGLHTPENIKEKDRENPLHNPLITPVPDDDEPVEDTPSPTVH